MLSYEERSSYKKERKKLGHVMSDRRKKLGFVLGDIVYHDKNYDKRDKLVFEAMNRSKNLNYDCGIRIDLDCSEYETVFWIELPDFGEVAWHMRTSKKPYIHYNNEEKFERIKKYTNYIWSIKDKECPKVIEKVQVQELIDFMNLTKIRKTVELYLHDKFYTRIYTCILKEIEKSLLYKNKYYGTEYQLHDFEFVIL